MWADVRGLFIHVSFMLTVRHCSFPNWRTGREKTSLARDSICITGSSIKMTLHIKATYRWKRLFALLSWRPVRPCSSAVVVRGWKNVKALCSGVPNAPSSTLHPANCPKFCEHYQSLHPLWIKRRSPVYLHVLENLRSFSFWVLEKVQMFLFVGVRILSKASQRHLLLLIRRTGQPGQMSFLCPQRLKRLLDSFGFVVFPRV